MKYKNKVCYVIAIDVEASTYESMSNKVTEINNNITTFCNHIESLNNSIKIHKMSEEDYLSYTTNNG